MFGMHVFVAVCCLINVNTSRHHYKHVELCIISIVTLKISFYYEHSAAAQHSSPLTAFSSSSDTQNTVHTRTPQHLTVPQQQQLSVAAATPQSAAVWLQQPLQAM
jgi:hypothetical protein